MPWIGGGWVWVSDSWVWAAGCGGEMVDGSLGVGEGEGGSGCCGGGSVVGCVVALWCGGGCGGWVSVGGASACGVQVGVGGMLGWWCGGLVVAMCVCVCVPWVDKWMVGQWVCVVRWVLGGGLGGVLPWAG